MTVDEMAEVLGITDNAVRAQLASLERDGLVEPREVRRGAGKPAQAYGLVTGFEEDLSRAYSPMLDRLLAELTDRMSEAELTELLRAAGRRWAESVPRPSRESGNRLTAAATLLDDLGAEVEIEPAGNKGLVIRGYSCPLATAVRRNPRVCAALESLLAELLGTPVAERCDRTTYPPRCRFEVGSRRRPA